MAQQETKQLNQIVVGADERSLYRLLRFLASHGLFRKTVNGAFDHTPFSSVLRSDAGRDRGQTDPDWVIHGRRRL